MTSTPIEYDGMTIALLVEGDDGRYIAPPIVFDEDDNVVMGREILAASVESGRTIQHPVIRGCAPGMLAEIEQHLTQVREQLGVPLGSL